MKKATYLLLLLVSDFRLFLSVDADCRVKVEMRRITTSPNPPLVLCPNPNASLFSFQRLYTDCLNRAFTRLSFLGGRPFRFGAIIRRVGLEFKIEYNTTERLKQTARQLIYVLKLNLDQNIQRLLEWRRINLPLRLEPIMATFWVPETTKRPRCIMVSDKGSLREYQAENNALSVEM